MTDDTEFVIDDGLLLEAFVAGFMASGEDYHADYPGTLKADPQDVARHEYFDWREDADLSVHRLALAEPRGVPADAERDANGEAVFPEVRDAE